MEATRDTTHDSRRRRGRIVRYGIAVTATLALLAAGCGDDDDDTTAAGGSESSGGDMTIDIVSPTDAATVGTSFDVEVDPSVDIGEPDTGLHHVHLYYDGNTAEGEYDLMYEPTFTVDRLDAGEHTIEAVIANADHSLTDARAEVTVTVGDAPAAGTDATDATTDTTAADDGYGY
jgi:hypothetical protein